MCADLEDIRADVRSKIWFTYRKGFVPIGDTGHTSDKGWGCMLRCGQMVLAQALLSLHVGKYNSKCSLPKVVKFFSSHNEYGKVSDCTTLRMYMS